MNVRQRSYSILVAILSLLAVYGQSLYAANGYGPEAETMVTNNPTQYPEGLKWGRVAPEFTGTVDGKTVNFADYARKYIVLNFWSSSSPESQQVKTEIAGLEKQYPASRVVFLHISLEENADIAALYGVSETPVIYIISPDKSLYAIKKNGAEVDEKLRKSIKKNKR